MDHIQLERLDPVRKPTSLNQEVARPRVPKTLNTEAYNAQFYHRDFSRLRNDVFAALPIPPNVIPVVASPLQVGEYEKLLVRSHNDNLTIRDIMEPYSLVRGNVEKDKFAKILFLKKFITKLTTNGVVRFFCISQLRKKKRVVTNHSIPIEL